MQCTRKVERLSALAHRSDLTTFVRYPSSVEAERELAPRVCISNGHGASTYGSAVEDSHVCWWGIVCNPSSVAVG